MTCFDVTGGTAIVTGAGSGIGAALARALAARGAHLALVDRDADRLDAMADELAVSGIRLTSHAADITAPGFADQLVADVTATHGGAALLVNNAGIAQGGTFEQIAEADFDRLMAVNFEAPVRLMRAFLPVLRQASAARIINISSIFGVIAPPGQSAYCASKFALRGLSEAMRHELAGSSVGILIVHPGGVDTNIARDSTPPMGVDPAAFKQQMHAFQKFLRLPPDRAAEIILTALDRGQTRVLVGQDAWLFDKLARLFPQTYNGWVDRVMRWSAG